MRDLQARMLAAVLDGEGLWGVAELAASEAGGPVAIVLPARGLAATAPAGEPPGEIVEYVASRLGGSPVERPASVEDELAVLAGEEEIGAVVALPVNGAGPRPLRLDLEAVLRSAATAALAEVAAIDARDRLAEDLRGGVLEDLRSGGVAVEEIVRRAGRVGCDLRAGAVVLAAEIRSGKPRFAAALVTSEWPGAIAEPVDGDRLLALLPGKATAASEGSPAASTLEAAKRIAGRLQGHGPAAFSSYCAELGELRRAVREAELALEVVARDKRLAEQLQGGIGEGVYRLLFRALASSPDEVRSFYRDTVEPLVDHDAQYRTDLLGTLESYLANDSNTNATARAVFAHRHTVAHRLERIRELTGLDPSVGEDRERLGLGVKAYRILAPALPR
jgi:hypothetical protein